MIELNDRWQLESVPVQPGTRSAVCVRHGTHEVNSGAKGDASFRATEFFEPVQRLCRLKGTGFIP